MIIKENVKNILITRTDRLGDVILALPLINRSKKIFKSAKVYFLVRKYVEELITNYNGIDELVIEEDILSFKEKYSYFKNINLDLVINVKPRFDLALLFFLLGVKYRIGTAYRWYSFLYNEKVYEHRKDSVKHEADYNMNLLNNFFEDSESEKFFFFKYSDKEKTELNLKLKELLEGNYIVIHPGSGGSAKDLPVRKFAEFANEFLEIYKGFKIVITGTESERVVTERLIRSVNKALSNRIIDTTGILNLKELAIVIDNSKIFFANSTGPIHIAGALNKNIIGFYPNETVMSETRWKPLSGNTVIIKPDLNSGDMSQIKVETILKAVKTFFNNSE